MERKPPAWHLGYRPALDGLRGIAIAMVVLGHVKAPGFDSGGWSGVTLFFVLSGFLITTLLLEERHRTGSIDLRAFYARRARRLLPALAVVLFIVTVVRLLLSSPGTVTDAIAVAGYYANWWRILTDAPMPALPHTWSLAVEEQFYILWPGLLIGLLLLTRGRLRWMIGVLLMGVIASAALRLVLPFERAALGTDTRADALLIGCALAIWFHVRGPWRPSRPLIYAAVAGYLLVTLPPSHPALFGAEVMVGLPIATISSAILLAAAASRGGSILSTAPLVGLGKISYGLYLWHVPVMGAIAGGMIADHVVAPLVAVMVAVNSYVWIERRFLRRRPVPKVEMPLGERRSATQDAPAQT